MQKLIDALAKNFPCSYGGNNHLHALNQLLVVNGSGYHWNKDGTALEYCFGKLRRDKPLMSAKKLHKRGFELLRKMPEFDPVTETESYGHFGLRKALVNRDHEAALDEWDLIDGTKAARTTKIIERINKDSLGSDLGKDPDYDVQTYLERLCVRPRFYTLDLERYSNVSQVDARAEPETVQACIDVLLAILSGPQGDEHHVRDNHVHALILLMQKHTLFRQHCCPGTKALLSLRKAVDDRNLAISSKEHVQNHKIDERKLTDEEYFWYHGLVLEGLTDEEIQLVRKYSFYLRWAKGRDAKRTEENNNRDHKRKRAFWKLFEAKQEGGKITIPKQTINDDDAAACVAYNQCVFKR